MVLFYVGLLLGLDFAWIFKQVWERLMIFTVLDLFDFISIATWSQNTI